METQLVLEARDICKRFGPVRALDGVSFDLRRGELHALVGANGAGKSTLIKVLSGFHKPDSGTLTLEDGASASFNSPRDSIAAGVACVHQEIDVAKDLAVYQNVFLGNDRQFVQYGLVDHKSMQRAAQAVLASLGLTLDVTVPVRTLSFSQMQMIMIANALAKGARILIFDEPTSSLSKNETEHLFLEIQKLKQRGISIIYISHHLDEVFRLADRASVLREGKSVGTVQIADVQTADLVRMMIGRSVDTKISRSCTDTGRCVLRIENLHTADARVNGVDLTLNQGQIIGLYGIVGAGRTELAKALFTGKNIASGTITLDGRTQRIKNERDAIRRGLSYSSEARKAEGLLLNMSVLQNISIAVLEKLARLSVIDRRRESELADTYIRKMGIVVPGKRAPVSTLSGGNQQKVVISRWFATESQVMIFDEPTVGIDIAAKADVLRIIGESADMGKSIIIISSEMDELFQICDLIHVMRQGRIEQTFYPPQYEASHLMTAATGGNTHE